MKMKKNFILILTAVIGLGLVVGDVPWVCAQGEQEFTLEEITVTAQKREANQQKVALAMDTVSAETIKELGRTDIVQILTDISNVQITKEGSAGLRISIRGVAQEMPTSFQGAQASTPTVAMNTDGIYSNRQDVGTDLFDIERVEVLFGPQATLYSSNTPGGIVNIITGSPKLGVTEGTGTIEYGNFGLLRTEGTFNAPVSETAAVRGAFSMTARDGFITDGTDDEDSKAARLKLLIQPNDALSFTVTGEYHRLSAKGLSGVVAFINQSNTPNPWTVYKTATYVPPVPNFTKRQKIYGQLVADVGIGTFTFVPSYRKQRYVITRTSATTNVVSTQTGRLRERSFEGRLSSKADAPFTYILGVTMYSTMDTAYTTQSDGGWHDTIFEDKQKAAYGNTTFPLTDQFRLTAGGRYSSVKYHSLDRVHPPRYAWQPDPSAEDGMMEYSGFDYKAGIEYDLAEQSMLYADTSTSYRTQGMAYKWPSDPNQKAQAFPPEKITAYNLGMKNRFFENRLQLNIASYYYDYKNYFAQGGVSSVSRIDLNGDGDYTDTVGGRPETIQVADENAKEVGHVKVVGTDISSSAVITDVDKLDFSVSYLKKFFERMFFNYTLTTNNLLGVPDLDLAGKPVSMAPEWTVNAAWSHNFLLGSGAMITTRLDSKYTSEYYLSWNRYQVTLNLATLTTTTREQSAYLIQEAYRLSNVSAVYVDASGKYTLTTYIKNVENYAVKLSGSSSNMRISPPRTYGAILSVKF